MSSDGRRISVGSNKRAAPLVRAFVVAVVAVAFTYLAISSVLFRLDDTPKQLAQSQETEEQRRAVSAQVREWRDAFDRGASTRLRVSNDQITALLKLSSNDGIRLLIDHSSITIRNARIHVDMALPLDVFGYPERFFNGRAVLSLAEPAKGDGGWLVLDELDSDSPRAVGVAWLVKRLYRRSLVDMLGIGSALPQELWQRCNILLEEGALLVECPADPF